MTHLFATIALGPLLLLQGRYVRRVTPKLPEPPGARQGECGEGPLLRLLILGDSAAAGVGAAHQDDALSGQLVLALSRYFRVCWVLQAQTGITTAETLQQLQAGPEGVFDVVVTSLGVNDVTSGRSPKRWIAEQARLVAVLRRDFGAPRILMSALPPMHLFPALPQPLRAYLGAQARRYNVALQAFAATTEGCTWVSLDLSADPAHMAQDGFHPGPSVYAAWAARLAALIAVPAAAPERTAGAV